MRANAQPFRARGTAFWGPVRTRDGLFHGLAPKRGGQPDPRAYRRAVGRVRLACDLLARQGVAQLIVSEENMIGACRRNLTQERLYPGLGERLARYAHVFGGRLSRVVLSIRALNEYWSSALAVSVPRGLAMPDIAALDRLVTQPRSWREVIADAACACGGAELRVAPFEVFAGRPEALARGMLDAAGPLPARAAREWHNRAPDMKALRTVLADRDEAGLLGPGQGRWMPFDDAQAAALRETYADDLRWLHAGADGLARLTEDFGQAAAGEHPRGPARTRGHINAIEERAMG